MSDEVHWSIGAHAALREQDISLAAYVPDGGLKELISLCHDDAEMRAVPLANESEGPCLLAGAWLGGQRGCLLMQGSGVGNCMNNFGLTIAGNFPLLTIVGLRGSWGEGNPGMLYHGRTVTGMLEMAGFLVYRVEAAAEVVETIKAGAQTVFNTSGRVAVLLSQRVTGAKQFKR